MNHRTLPPTQRQQRYLRALAQQRGMTFTIPTTRAQARMEIERLKGMPRSTGHERRADRDVVRNDMAAGPASSVRRDEVAGYGSTARCGGIGGEEAPEPCCGQESRRGSGRG